MLGRTLAVALSRALRLFRHVERFHQFAGREHVESLDEKKALKRGLGVDRATDILWTLNHPDVWQLLVGERGWTPEQYEQEPGRRFPAPADALDLLRAGLTARLGQTLSTQRGTGWRDAATVVAPRYWRASP